MSNVLRGSGLTRRFGDAIAVDAVDFELRTGEVHALVGANGAGKSTLVAMLSGELPPSSGEITLNNQPIPIGRPNAFREAGIALVPQHPHLVGAMSIRENLELSLRRSPWSWRDRVTLQARIDAALEMLGWDLSLDARASGLGVAARGKVELIKALLADPNFLFLDEPTATLNSEEIDAVLQTVESLRAAGKGIVLIAHKLHEVFRVADRVTALREGRVVGAGLRGELQPEVVATWIVPDMQTQDSSRRTPDRLGFGGELLAKLSELAAPPRLRAASLEIRRGEILGISAIEGNGESELAELLAGVVRSRETAQLSRLKIAYIPEDRRHDGLALELSTTENLLPAWLKSPEVVTRGWIHWGRARARATQTVADLAIAGASATAKVGRLSGGNAQKVVLARAIEQTPDLLVAVNPTRGLDLGASAEIHRRLRKLADWGTAIVLFTSDLEELASLASRRAFLREGVLHYGDDPTTMVLGEALPQR